jgi:hypothetical protein
MADDVPVRLNDPSSCELNASERLWYKPMQDECCWLRFSQVRFLHTTPSVEEVVGRREITHIHTS